MNASDGLTIQCKVHFRTTRRGKRLQMGERPEPPIMPVGRVPRVARLMALAIHLEDLVLQGHVRDYAELARLGHVSRARLSQIMNLLCLAPDIQEELLDLPRVEHGRDPIRELQLRPITLVPDWRKQRRMWRELTTTTTPPDTTR